MKVVQLRLRPPTLFWGLGSIFLQKEKNETSPWINIEKLSDPQKAVINRSVAAEEIMLYDYEGNRVYESLSNLNVIYGNYVSEDDIDEEEDMIPEVISVTVDNDDKEEIDLELSEEDIENARILLSKHWSTIKKTILSFEKTTSNLRIIHAALEIELEDKKRKGVISALQEVLME